MKYRYVLTRDDAKKKLTIREFTRGIDGHLVMMGSRDLTAETVEETLPLGAEALMQKIRSLGMYPPEEVAMQMAELAMNLYGPNRDDINEGHVDEVDVMTPEPEPVEPTPDDESEGDESGLPEEDILETDDLELDPKEVDSSKAAEK